MEGQELENSLPFYRFFMDTNRGREGKGRMLDNSFKASSAPVTLTDRFGTVRKTLYCGTAMRLGDVYKIKAFRHSYVVGMRL